ncbi:hypothetical protein CPU05_07765 [Pediococcus acidilactici]|nr:hypothetical protein CPU05_07765 [Pediococcus acidilactici]
MIAQTKLVDKHAQISKHLRITIIAKLVKDTSVENIVQDLNLSPNTINRQIAKIHNCQIVFIKISLITSNNAIVYPAVRPLNQLSLTSILVITFFVKRLFPNAQIIAHRFHLIQMLNCVTTQVRIATMRQFQWNSREYHLLKYHWRLYLKLFNQLESKNPT